MILAVNFIIRHLLRGNALLLILVIFPDSPHHTRWPLITRRLPPGIFWLPKFENAETVPKQTFNNATHGVNTANNWANAYHERGNRLQAHRVLDSNWWQFVSEEDGWHASFRFYRLGRSVLEGFEDLRPINLGIIRPLRLIHIVHLTNLQKVIHKQTTRAHKAHHAGLNEFALLNIASIQFKIQPLSKIILNMLDIAKITKT